MTITPALIRSTAESYTRAELVNMRKAALAALAEGEYISSASTGAGASYSLSQRAAKEELIELYTAAIHYQDTGTLESGASVFHFTFHP